MRTHLHLYLNGRPLEIRGGDVFRTLSDFLREGRRMMGTKIVCEEGDCGACTVLIGRAEEGRMVYRPVNSCILQMHQLDCTHVVSVEGVATNGALSEVQESMVRHHGAQCGFCTPGFVTAMAAMFETKEQLTERDVRRGLTGNLCRCTGYEPIIKAALNADPAAIQRVDDLYPPDEMLASFEQLAGESISVEADGRRFAAPAELAEAVRFKGENAGAVIVQGATDVGVWCNKRFFEPEAVLNISKVPGMDRVAVRKPAPAPAGGVLEVGGCVTLQELQDFIRELIPEFWEILEIFGSPQIRAAGTLAGNIGNGSPIADTLPFLYVMEAELELAGGRKTVDGGQTTVGGGPEATTETEITDHEILRFAQDRRITNRRIPITDFYRGYKSFDLAPDEIITRILIPLPAESDLLRLYKVSKRRDLDISSFTAAVLMRPSGGVIDQIRISYGGVGPVVYRLSKTEAFLTGREISEETFVEAGPVARGEITPISDVRGSADFRYQLAENILRRFYYEVAGEEVEA